MEEKPTVFFDGVCNFCNYWVNFSIRRDRKKKLRFAPIQGETAKKLFPRYDINPSHLHSVIFIENDKAYENSSAALRIARHLGGGWKLLYGLIIVPKFLRDAVYKWIAKNRYKWFGKKDSCMIPEPGVRERFLE